MTHPTVNDAGVLDEGDLRAEDGRASRRAPLRDAAWVLGVHLCLGLVGAVLWWLLVDPAMFTKAESGGLAMGEVQLARRFNADGWFVVIAAVSGLLSGSVLTWWRSRDFLLTSLLLVVGSAVAATVMAVLGRVLGPADPGSVAAGLPVGAQVAMQLEVSGTVCFLVWPIAVLAGALFVLWSPPTDTVG